MTGLEREIWELMVKTLMLDDVTADEIGIDDPLFIGGLGLDSIDALELALAIDRKYGVRITATDAETQKIFSNVRSLAEYVGQHKVV